MGRKFSLVLNREVTDEESVTLRRAGCAAAIFGKDKLLTNAEVTVTKMDFDEIGSMTLVEAIEAALRAVRQVPDLNVPGLTAPIQVAKPAQEEPGTEIEGVTAEEAIEDVTAEEEPSTEKVPAA
jgi:hypothetical protein